MNKIVRITLSVLVDLLILPILFFSLLNTELSLYLFRQAKGQLTIMIQSKDIDELLGKGNFNHAERNKLKLIEEIKSYSVEKLNFKPSKSYSNFFDQKGKNLIWNVTACEPYSFEAYQWKYPILGKLSYKGFFDSIKAVNEINRLRKLGLDADLSGVQAWSTLGFLSDPIFSEMLKKSKGELCELLFHELFHGTIYAPGSTELNENLAEFVAKNATIQFLKNDTTSLNIYKTSMKKENFINKFMLNAIESLKFTYIQIKRNNISDNEAIQLKKDKIMNIITNLNKTTILSEKSKKRIAKRIINSGNAYLMHFNRYNFMEDSLNYILDERFKGRLDLMILDLKRNISSI